MPVLRRINIERREEILSALRRFLERISSAIPDCHPIVFGSFASGKIHEGSDIDLLVVADFKERFHERIVKVLDFNEESLPVEPLCLTPSEFESLLANGNAFIRRVLETGVEYKRGDPLPFSNRPSRPR